MDESEPYATAKGVEDAIKAAAKRDSTDDPALTTNERIRLEYFNRFLSRVFSDGPDSEWVLKGGTGMLARVASTRWTRDIDLYRGSYGLDEAVEDLRRLAERDLGDFFRFVYTGHQAILAGEAQPYTDGYRVEFDTYIGAQKKSSIGVDLSTGAGLTAEPTITAPASALDLPRLVGFEYRLYPVVDQIADKVCATMQRYDDRPSSREKDLVDIVVLAVTQDIDGTALTTAITTESSRREMDPIEHFVVPAQWAPRTRSRLSVSPTALTSLTSTTPRSSPRLSSILRWRAPQPGSPGELQQGRGFPCSSGRGLNTRCTSPWWLDPANPLLIRGDESGGSSGTAWTRIP